MRIFTLVDGTGEEYPLVSHYHMFYSPSGLGFEEENTYRRVGSHFLLASTIPKMSVISGVMHFGSDAPYTEYRKFLDFCSRRGLQMTYYTGEGQVSDDRHRTTFQYTLPQTGYNSPLIASSNGNSLYGEIAYSFGDGYDEEGSGIRGKVATHIRYDRGGRMLKCASSTNPGNHYLVRNCAEGAVYGIPIPQISGSDHTNNADSQVWCSGLPSLDEPYDSTATYTTNGVFSCQNPNAPNGTSGEGLWDTIYLFLRFDAMPNMTFTQWLNANKPTFYFKTGNVDANVPFSIILDASDDPRMAYIGVETEEHGTAIIWVEQPVYLFAGEYTFRFPAKYNMAIGAELVYSSGKQNADMSVKYLVDGQYISRTSSGGDFDLSGIDLEEITSGQYSGLLYGEINEMLINADIKHAELDGYFEHCSGNVVNAAAAPAMASEKYYHGTEGTGSGQSKTTYTAASNSPKKPIRYVIEDYYTVCSNLKPGLKYQITGTLEFKAPLMYQTDKRKGKNKGKITYYTYTDKEKKAEADKPSVIFSSTLTGELANGKATLSSDNKTYIYKTEVNKTFTVPSGGSFASLILSLNAEIPNQKNWKFGNKNYDLTIPMTWSFKDLSVHPVNSEDMDLSAAVRVYSMEMPTKLNLYAYGNDEKRYFRKVRLEKIEKGELNRLGYLEARVSFSCISPWGDKVSAYPSHGTVAEIETDPHNANILTVVSDSVTPSPCTLQIVGPMTNPTWQHYVDGELIATGGYKGSLTSSQTLIIDSDYLGQSMTLYTGTQVSGETVYDESAGTDVYKNRDFTKDCFLYLRGGTNVIKVAGGTSGYALLKGDILYESV